MVRAIREHLTVEKDGSIEIHHPELVTGSRAEVIVLLERSEEAADLSRAQAAAPIWEVADQVARSVSAEEWAEVPTDLSKHLDHYLYGAPKDGE